MSLIEPGQLRNATGVSLVALLACGFHSEASGQQAEISELQRIVASDAAGDGIFGSAVAIDGDVAVVGSEGDDDLGAFAGAAYVLRWNGVEWADEQKLIGSQVQNGDLFGAQVDVEGVWIAVTSAYASPHASGEVYLFRFDGTAWNEVQKLSSPSPEGLDSFGRFLDLDGDRLLVGESGDEPCGFLDCARGAAHVYQYDGSTWNLEQTLKPQDLMDGDYFGIGGAIEGDRILVSSPYADDVAVDQGAVYTFEWNGASWVERLKTTLAAPAASDVFGWDLALDGDRVCIGAPTTWFASTGPGAAYVFEWNGTTWQERQKFVPSVGVLGDWFGISVALEEDSLLIGAPHNRLIGSAFAYRHDGTAFTAETRLRDSLGTAGDDFGTAVAIDGPRAFVGAKHDDWIIQRTGTAFAFDLPLETAFDAVPKSVVVGNTLNLTTQRGDPGQAALLFVASPDGSLTYALPVSGTFDAAGNWLVSGTLTRSPLQSLHFRVLSFSAAGGFELSNLQAIDFQ